MLSSLWLLLSFLPLFFTQISEANDQLIPRSYKCNKILGNFTDGSDYGNNRDMVLAQIYSDKKIDYGFYNFSYGVDTDQVNAIGICRGDIKPDDCRACLKTSAAFLTNWCQLSKEAIVYYDLCTSLSEPPSTTPSPEASIAEPPPSVPPPETASPPESLPSTPPLETGKSWKFITAIVVPVVLSGIVLIVGICIYCLRWRTPRSTNTAVESEAALYITKNGGSARINTKGQEKYEEEVFFEATNEEEFEIEIETEVANDLKVGDILQYDFEIIRLATNNFSDANILGEGGFGIVYKGMLPNGQDIAIKRLANNSKQGEIEFENEVLLTGKLQHRNLVKLLGFCLQRKERLLIYEFVTNKSLDYIIFDPIKRANLNWERRYKIIRDIARGLLYLHEDSRLQIVHRDLKTSNILIDEELNPKITDFGIARLFDANQTHGMTKTLVGTFGYMAPEYIRHGEFSVKSYVFSYGIIILEIICGRRIIENHYRENPEDLLSIAWKNWKAGTTSDIVDPLLDQGFNKNEKMRSIHVGLLCVQEDIAMRPTMSSVLTMLNSTSFPLPEPLEPPFSMHPRMALSLVSTSDSGSGGSQFTRGSTTKSSATD